MSDSTRPISPLRQRMIDDMTMRKLTTGTQRGYIRAVKQLTRFLGRSPGEATAEICVTTSCIWLTRASPVAISTATSPP